MTTNLSADLLELAVCYILPYTADKHEQWAAQAQALYTFFSKKEIFPFPMPLNNHLVLTRTSEKAEYNRAWLNFLISAGVSISYCVRKTKTTASGQYKVVLEGKEMKFRHKDLYNQEQAEVTFDPYKYEDGDEDKRTLIYVHNVRSFVAEHFCAYVDKLSPEDKALLISLLNPKIEVDGTFVVVKKANGGFTVDFKEGTLVAPTAMYEAKPFVTFGENLSCSGTTALALLTLSLSQSEVMSYQLAGHLAALPNLWVEDPNYGVALKGDMSDPAVVIPYYSSGSLIFTSAFQAVVGSNSYPAMTVGQSDTKVNMESAAKLLHKEGVITGDKYLLKFVAGKLAANAALLGDGGEVIYTWHDAGKASKLWNRPMQARKFLKAEQYTDDSYSISCRKQSKIGTLLSDGSIVYQKGRMMLVGLSTSALCMGSGAAAMNKNTKFFTGVKKTMTGRINVDDFPMEVQAYFKEEGVKQGYKAHHTFNFLKKLAGQKVARILESKDTKMYAPGETILDITVNPKTKQKKVILKNDFANCSLRVISIEVASMPVEDTDYSPQYFNIYFTVEMLRETQEVKLRRDYIKATTVPMDFALLDVTGQNELEFNNEAGEALPVEIVFNNETIKGRSIHLDAFAHTHEGYCINHPNEAKMVWHKLNGDQVEIDLLQADNLVSEWVQKAAIDCLLEMDIPMAEWDKLQEAGSLSAIHSVDDHQSEGYVTVREQIQLLLCNIPIEVEIATPDESIGTSALTPEMLCGIGAQSRKLAEVLWEEAKPYQTAVKGLINMATKTKAINETNAVCLTNAEQRNAIIKAIGSLDGLSDAAVLQKYKKLYPNGVYFTSSGSKTVGAMLYLDFDVIRTTMVWISGSADQISQEIVSFLRKVPTPPSSGYDTYYHTKISGLSKSLAGWIAKAFESKGILKRAARSSKCLINLKVRTCYYKLLQPDVDGLPKVAAHPGCDSISLLAKDSSGAYYKKYLQHVKVAVDEGDTDGDGFDASCYLPNQFCRVVSVKTEDNIRKICFFNPYLLQGEFVAAFRIPMFMALGAKLVLSQSVGKSHLFVLPYFWSMANEGDTDGDGVSMLNLGARGLTLSDVIEMNNSWLGLLGYKFSYGKKAHQWPYAEFSETPKKKLLKWDNEFDHKKYCKPYVTCIPKFSVYTDGGLLKEMGFFESGQEVQKHYRGPVGIGYGIASVLTFQLANAMYNPVQTNEYAFYLSALKLAVVVVWRRIYEGLGLAGYSPEASRWFKILAASKISKTFVEKDGQYYYPGHRATNPKDVAQDAIVPLLYLGQEQKPGNGLSNFWLNEDGTTNEIGYKLMYKAMSLICEAEAIRTFYSGTEKGSNVVKAMQDPKIAEDAIIFGSLRRMGQGADPAGIQNMDIDGTDPFEAEDEVTPQSLFVLASVNKSYETLHNPYLADLLQSGTEIHTQVSLYLYNLKVSEAEQD